jgi:tRNA threonylcarbamoyladenosine biosynthesis protein TsaE
VILKVPDAAAMEALGARLADAHEPGLAIFIRGELGAGKTTLTRGFLRALGHSGAVKSPTYTLVEPYESGAVSVYHFDFYRLSEPEELEFMGIRDYFGDDGICLVEWPERAAGRLPRPDVEIDIAYSDSGRRVTVTAITPAGTRVAARLGAHKTL